MALRLFSSLELISSFFVACILLLSGRSLRIGVSAETTLPASNDIDLLQFALTLEYLEAEFYSWAAFDEGLSTFDAGAGPRAVGGQKALLSPMVQNLATQFAASEINHVRFLRSVITAAGASPVARPLINIGAAFSTAADLAVSSLLQGSSLVPPFSPYGDDILFLLGAFFLEDIGLSFYVSASPIVRSSAYVTPFAALLSVEAYHGGAVRLSLKGHAAEYLEPWGISVVSLTDAFTNLRGVLGGGSGEPGLSTGGSSRLSFSSNSTSISPGRNSSSVLSILYGGNSTGGLFFPAGLSFQTAPTPSAPAVSANPSTAAPTVTPHLPSAGPPSVTPSSSPPVLPVETRSIPPGTAPPQYIPPPSPSLAPPSQPPSSSSLPLPAILGSVAGAAAVLVFLVGFCLLCRHRRRQRPQAVPAPADVSKHQPAQAAAPAPVQPRRDHFTPRQLRAATDSFADARIIGRGSFGVVYLATLANGARVAVKRLSQQPTRRDGVGSAWKAEVEALGKVRHKNLAPLLGVCAESGERLLVFEYFARGSLSRRLHEGCEAGLSWAERMHIARGICRGLVYLHNDIRPSMIHRDIKAANVLLTDDEPPEACIADFGLAHLMQGDAGANFTSTMVKGTVPYMAPEYLHGGSRFLSRKCDVYSFGMLLLELVSGRPVVRQQPNGLVERLSKVAWELVKEGRGLDLLDPRLENQFDAQEASLCIQVALACLQKDPSLRPEIEDVASQLAPRRVAASNSGTMQLRDAEGSWNAEIGSVSLTSGSDFDSQSSAPYQSTVLVESRFITPR